MNDQQLRRASASLPRRLDAYVRGIGLAALVLLALAAALTLRQPAFAPTTAPPARVIVQATAWPDGMGSVYDGGAYGAQPVARPTTWPSGTGSVYDGR